MKEIIFVTGNPRKIEEATAVLAKYDTKMEAKSLDINEIQHSDPRQISETKAREAYKKLGKPIVVNDSFWEIPALGGFPGGYMKEVNAWLSAQDFLNLMRDKKRSSHNSP